MKLLIMGSIALCLTLCLPLAATPTKTTILYPASKTHFPVGTIKQLTKPCDKREPGYYVLRIINHSLGWHKCDKDGNLLPSSPARPPARR